MKRIYCSLRFCKKDLNGSRMRACHSYGSLRSKDIVSRPCELEMGAQQTDYSKWSNQSLIERVTQLEQQLREQAARYGSSSVSWNLLKRNLRFTASPSLPEVKSSSPALQPKNPRASRDFDPSKYSTRLIALKFAYLGQRYNGFEHHANNKTPLPTIEEELWKALTKACLISPTTSLVSDPEEVRWEGCDYSKCGRTDKGVSAFGQVVGIRVRTNRPRIPSDQYERSRGSSESAGHLIQSTHLSGANGESQSANGNTGISSSELPLSEPSHSNLRPFHHVNDELPYVQILNRILPEDIRVLAWCPTVPTDFSARFSCRERRYRYFFTQPAFAPLPGADGFTVNQRHGQPRREGWLDIDAMREGARYFEGLHDFRNFCKVDPSKQMTNFERRIFRADIEVQDPNAGPVGYIANPGFQVSKTHKGPETTSNGKPPDAVSSSTPQIYTLVVHGSAFLWHQIRHMAAILFLIGQGLESPDLIPALLDVKNNPTKPMYDMADDAPLVLWDCIFPREGSDSREDALEWVYVGDQIGTENGTVTGSGKGKYGMGGVVDDVWRVWRGRKIDEVLAGMLLDVVAGQGSPPDGMGRQLSGHQGSKTKPRSQKLFEGGNTARFIGQYVPVLQRKRLESVEIVNARFAARKGLVSRDPVSEVDLRNSVPESTPIV